MTDESSGPRLGTDESPRPIASVGDDRHALCGKHPGDLGTDAGTAAGDQGTLSDEFQIHADRLR